MREWRLKHSEARREYQREYDRKTSEAKRRRDLKRKYGISVGVYDIMLAKQGGVCALCGQPPGQKRLAVDHDHAKVGPESVRGLLCFKCNKSVDWIAYYHPQNCTCVTCIYARRA